MNLLICILITLFLIGVLLSIVYIIVGFILEKKGKNSNVEEEPVLEEKVEEQPQEEAPSEPVEEAPKEDKKEE